MADHILTEMDETGNHERKDEHFCCPACGNAEAEDGQVLCAACLTAISLIGREYALEQVEAEQDAPEGYEAIESLSDEGPHFRPLRRHPDSCMCDRCCY